MSLEATPELVPKEPDHPAEVRQDLHTAIKLPDINIPPAPYQELPTVDLCLAHLKLLHAFHQLKLNIGYRDGLWNIWDSKADIFEQEDERKKALSKLREKRWALFVARAAHRYQIWWSSLGGTPLREQDTKDNKSPKYATFSEGSIPEPQKAISLVPLDVLLVWHAHMLNPRIFFEDTMRSGLGTLWLTGMPWTIVNDAIDDHMKYEVSNDCKQTWVDSTKEPWDSLDGADTVTIQCPGCKSKLEIPWTTCGGQLTLDEKEDPGLSHPTVRGQDDMFLCSLDLLGNGYGDGPVRKVCDSCELTINNDILCVAKFIHDTRELIDHDIPMPGTLLDPRSGKVEFNVPLHGVSKERSALTFPNRLVRKIIGEKVAGQMEQARHGKKVCIASVTRKIRRSLRDRQNWSLVNGDISVDRLESLSERTKRIIRRTMSHYYDNFSMFGRDLRGAVMRQGLFIEKMYKINWLYSPAAKTTMERLIQKYERFLLLIKQSPGKMGVPTLDVDLAWHTHQLSPQGYYRYTTSLLESFLDHDDMVEQSKLSKSFEWTCTKYQKLYGEVYSECTCWYCEALRAAHTSSFRQLISLSKRDKAYKTFHESAANYCPPENSAHISSHNAVQMEDNPWDMKGWMQYLKHNAAREKGYASALKLAQNNNRDAPKRNTSHDHWGYSYTMPGPWVCPLFFEASFYAADLAHPSEGSNINADGDLGGCVTECENLASCGSDPSDGLPKNDYWTIARDLTDVFKFKYENGEYIPQAI